MFIQLSCFIVGVKERKKETIPVFASFAPFLQQPVRLNDKGKGHKMRRGVTVISPIHLRHAFFLAVSFLSEGFEFVRS